MHGITRASVARAATASEISVSRKPTNSIKGCCGALYRIAVKIKKHSDVVDPTQYYYSKGYYALPYRIFWAAITFSCV